MGLVAVIREMLGKGLSIEQALMAAEVIEARETSALDARRANDRQRKARQRQKSRDVTNVTDSHVKAVTPSPLPSPQRLSNQTPLPSLLPFTDSLGSESGPLAEKENDFKELADWFEGQWNGLAQACGLPAIRAMTDARLGHIRRRADDLVKALRFPDSRSGFTETFNRIRGSPWLRGANGRAWKADVDWVLTESNFLHIHEGKYAADKRPERSSGH